VRWNAGSMRPTKTGVSGAGASASAVAQAAVNSGRQLVECCCCEATSWRDTRGDELSERVERRRVTSRWVEE
jgi:hypothetical protein